MRESDNDNLVQRFRVVAQFLNRMFFHEQVQVDMVGGVDLTLPQVKTLALLETRGPLSMTSIACLMGRTVSAMTQLIERLVEKGLVTRQSGPPDRRRVICALTEEGAQTMLQFWSISEKRIRVVSDLMTNDQLIAAVVGLEMIRDVEIQRASAVLPPEAPAPPEP